MKYDFSAELWLYPGNAAWHFITLPKQISGEIKEMHGQGARGFGSLRVTASIGHIDWLTSIFPDKKTGCYLLPVKKEIRNLANWHASEVRKIRLVLEN